MSANLIRLETELAFNQNPRFTKWLAKSDALHEPFVLIDVGVLGGENPRWHFLGDHLVVHGFDAAKEAVEDLSQSNAASPNKYFHWFAIGNEDGDRKFFYNPSNPSNSSFSFLEFPETQARIVPVRRLDTLLRERVIPKADFLKVDVEGHERQLFWGASDLLASGILGVETETSFVTSVDYPEAGFHLVRALLIKHGLVMSDLNFNRVRCENYQKARKLRGLPELPLEGAGKPATFNVLFCRDLVAEISGGVYYEKLPPPPRVDQILKLMVIYELHGLNDIAVDIAMTFSNELGQRLNVERAIDLLCDFGVADPAYNSPAKEYLAEIQALKLSLVAVRRRVHTLHRKLSADLTSPERLASPVVAELEKIKAELNSVILAGHEPPHTDQFTYEGHGQTDSVIPEDRNDVTRHHGAGILYISPRPGTGVAELHMRVLLNCHCSEPNSVRVAVFQDGSEEPLAVLTEHLIAAELTMIDQDFVASVADASRPPVFEIRVGLAHSGGTLSLNHVPGQDGGAAFASAVRLRWLPAW